MLSNGCLFQAFWMGQMNIFFPQLAMQDSIQANPPPTPLMDRLSLWSMAAVDFLDFLAMTL